MKAISTRLELHQEFAKLAIRQEPAKLSVHAEPPRLLHHKEPLSLEIERQAKGLEIQGDAAWDALGLGRYNRTTPRLVQAFHQKALAYIAQIAQEGDRLAAIHLEGNPILEMSKDWRLNLPEMKAIAGEPSPDNLNISYEPDELTIRWNKGDVSFSAVTQPVELSVDPGYVQSYLQQKNALRVDVVNVDREI